MGADGGSIPSRKELVQKALNTNIEQRFDSFEVCSLSGRRLDYSQLVCDYYGRLYNMESVLEYLLAKSKSIPQLHSLKDVISLQPHVTGGRWKCPLSYRDICEESPSTAFAAVPCGHVAQASLFKSQCPLCETEFEIPIYLNASGQDLERQKAHFSEIKEKHKAARAAAKKSKQKSEG